MSANPWKLDTAGASVIYAFPVKIVNILWANEAANDTLLIQDSNGKTIISATATSGLSQNHFGSIGWVRGLILRTLTSGVVTIAIGAGK